MSIKKKRLQLRVETLRNLSDDELNGIQGGMPIPPSWGGVGCDDPHPNPWPKPWPIDDPDPTPPDGFPPIKFPRPKNQAHKPNPRSANGFCTGV